MKMLLQCTTVCVLVALCGCAPEKHATPDEIINSDASIARGVLKGDPLGWRVITSRSDRKAHQMSTLYGNDAAITTQRKGFYDHNAVLALVTWTSKEDPHWYGAYIPAKPQRVEYAEAFATGPDSVRWNYSRMDAPNLQQPVTVSPDEAKQRLDWMTTQKMAIMP